MSLPDRLAAHVLKTLAWNARLADKDIVDVNRCLAVARISSVTPTPTRTTPPWPHDGSVA